MFDPPKNNEVEFVDGVLLLYTVYTTDDGCFRFRRGRCRLSAASSIDDGMMGRTRALFGLRWLEGRPASRVPQPPNLPEPIVSNATLIGWFSKNDVIRLIGWIKACNPFALSFGTFHWWPRTGRFGLDDVPAVIETAGFWDLSLGGVTNDLRSDDDDVLCRFDRRTLHSTRITFACWENPYANKLRRLRKKIFQNAQE